MDALALREDELRDYRERGYVVRSGVLASQDLEPLREAVEGIHRRVEAAALDPNVPTERIDRRRYQRLCGSTVKWEWREGSNRIRSMEPFVHLDPRLARLVEDPRLWQPAAALLGCRTVSLFTDKLNFKRPGGSEFPFHQDAPYWAFGCDHLDKLSSLQLYLDDATRENGCLWMIPGSQRQGHLACYSDRGRLGRLYTDLRTWKGAEPVPIEAPAGSAIYFDGWVVHGSQPNRTPHSR
ncbi:MAG: phytanoyl-CoA dioxygenase family protein, partial [Myxococcota bacterium]